MKRNSTLALLLAAASLFAFAASFAGNVPAATATPVLEPAAQPGSHGSDELEATTTQSRICQELVLRLEHTHFHDLDIDDALSSMFFDELYRTLDPSRLFFLAGDVRSFERHRTRMDEAFSKGDLSVPFQILRLYQERRISRMELLLGLLEQNLDSLDFSAEEVIEIDRDDAAWAATQEEMDNLWRHRFKNDVLSLKLADQDSEKIKETLHRRYTNQLLRIKQFNSEDVFRISMNVLTQCFGPHTEYMPPRDAENFDIHMSLSFEGIGALLGTEGEYCKIERLIPGGPAEKDGKLNAADRIVSVGQDDDTEMVDIVGWRVDEVVELIRGPKGTRVRLGILPANQSDTSAVKLITMMRGQVKLEEQAAKLTYEELERGGKTYKVGIIDLPAFYVDFEGQRRGDPNFRSSARDVEGLVREAMEAKVDGILVDLSANGGGSLTEVQELTGMFIGAGPVVQIKDTLGRTSVLDTQRERLYGGPLAVLVSRLSASASEIFAAAIQDTGRGIVVGSRTFGKGTVQTLDPVGRGGQLKLTQAMFYRITGSSTQLRGVQPDVLFPPVYDPEEIGESALDNALPWDRIEDVDHGRSPVVEALGPKLLRSHAERVKNDAEFVYLTQRLDLSRQERNREFLSLNEEQRKRQRLLTDERLLAIENTKRSALGLDAIEDLDVLAEESAEDEKETGNPLVEEAAEVLVDFLTLAKKFRVVNTDR